MSIERRPYDPETERERWLQWHREDVVTGSVIAALWNEHPFVTPFKLYQAGRGAEFPEHETAMMRRGRLLEPVADPTVKEERPEWTLEKPNIYVRETELRVGGTPDRLIHGDPRGLGILEIKNTNRDFLEDDWEDGTVVPGWVKRQLWLYAWLMQPAFIAAAVIVVERRDVICHVIEVPLDPTQLSDIAVRVRQFREDVYMGREPPPDFARDADVIKALTRHEVQGKQADLSGNNEIPMLLATRERIRERMAQDKAECEVIEAELKFLMGDAEMVTGLSGWHISYKTEPRKGYTVQPSEPRVLRIYDRRDREERV